MSDDQPLVSIVTPVYNGSEHLEDLIRSVLEQDYANLEHIIIDDGSTDGGKTVAILERYPHLRWWSRENRGQFATVNEGLLAATGDVFTTMNHDDIYASRSVFTNAVSAWNQHPQWDAVCGRQICTDEQCNRLPAQAPEWRWPRGLILYYHFIPHAALLIKRQFLTERDLLFNSGYRYEADRDWAIRLHRSGAKIGFIDVDMVFFRAHQGQISATVSNARKGAEHREIDRKYGASPTAARAVRFALKWCRRYIVAGHYLAHGGIRRLLREIHARARR